MEQLLADAVARLETAGARDELLVDIVQPRWLGVKGWLSHWSSGPVGTTSVWPANNRVLAGAAAPEALPARLA